MNMAHSSLEIFPWTKMISVNEFGECEGMVVRDGELDANFFDGWSLLCADCFRNSWLVKALIGPSFYSDGILWSKRRESEISTAVMKRGTSIETTF